MHQSKVDLYIPIFSSFGSKAISQRWDPLTCVYVCVCVCVHCPVFSDSVPVLQPLACATHGQIRSVKVNTVSSGMTGNARPSPGLVNEPMSRAAGPPDQYPTLCSGKLNEGPASVVLGASLGARRNADKTITIKRFYTDDSRARPVPAGKGGWQALIRLPALLLLLLLLLHLHLYLFLHLLSSSSSYLLLPFLLLLPSLPLLSPLVSPLHLFLFLRPSSSSNSNNNHASRPPL